MHRQRSWPHQRHVAFEHIPQLRQFIETCVAQKSADPSQPRIIFHLERWAILLASGLELVLLAIGAVHHRAKFDDEEWPPAATRALLFKKHRPRRTHLH